LDGANTLTNQFASRIRRFMRPKVIVPVLLGALALYLLVALAMVYLGTRPERKPFEASPEDFGLQYEDVSFTPRDGSLTLRGWLLSGSPEAPYLIFVHGIGDQRTGNDALDLASRLVKDDGYNVLVFDLRAQGTSDGSFVSAGEFERYDVLGAYDFLLSHGAEPGRVGLIGRSYGAATAIMAASMEPGIAAVVADSPFADVQDRIARETARKTPMPQGLVRLFLPPARVFASVLYGIDLGDLKPEKDVAKLAYPVLIIHGEADERIPISEGRRVYAAAPPGSEMWTLPGVTHTQGFQTYPDEYVGRVEAYLAARFGP
jgi:dipeptidyl aminopeptidase/acylaminoacyl peptidase